MELMQKALASLDEHDEPTRREILESDGWIEILQDPAPELQGRLRDYFEWYDGKREENPGELLEEVAYLLFKSLRGAENIRSYRSFAAQHDLVVDGSSVAWQILMTYLHLPKSGRSIIVECKNEKTTISDQQFSRLCGILQNKFETTAHLGVFISRKTAAGFPEGKRKKISLSEARATQVIFHAKTQKFVIVVAHKDLEKIFMGLPFPKILEAKISEVEAAYGTEISFDDDSWEQETKLPSHLEKYN
ncbi:MAG: hypothetical protein KG029_03395 [Bacteroidetes bacterium]|nr:hypothetical protein [Bacteroidota bacterium]